MPGEIVAVTGHRPEKIGGYRIPNPTYRSIIQALRTNFIELAPSLVLSGMALGVDQWAAELCITMGIPFTACLPLREEAFNSKWPAASKVKLRYLLSMAHQVIVVTDGPYEPWVMQARNQWMVDRCAVLLAVFNGSDGGTANCIDYAQRFGRPVKFINVPATPSVEDSVFVRTTKPAPIVAQIAAMAQTRPEEPLARPKYGRVFTGSDE